MKKIPSNENQAKKHMLDLRFENKFCSFIGYEFYEATFSNKAQKPKKRHHAYFERLYVENNLADDNYNSINVNKIGRFRADCLQTGTRQAKAR